MFNQDLKTGLSIVWNTGPEAMFMIDQEELSLATNCLIFLTEYHQIDDFDFARMNVIQFNRPFYCVEKDDAEVGCKGVLFFGARYIPKVQVPADRLRQFQLVWDSLMMEVEETDTFQLEMLRALLKRFLILSLRLYKQQELNVAEGPTGISLIREFNYLVEQHFRTLSRVADYADLLHKSPKTLTNTFRRYTDQSPLQVINDRRMLESKRLLRYTDKTMKEIAHEINFRDAQSFSHFFHQRVGEWPTDYRHMRKRSLQREE